MEVFVIKSKLLISAAITAASLAIAAPASASPVVGTTNVSATLIAIDAQGRPTVGDRNIATLISSDANKLGAVIAADTTNYICGNFYQCKVK